MQPVLYSDEFPLAGKILIAAIVIVALLFFVWGHFRIGTPDDRTPTPPFRRRKSDIEALFKSVFAMMTEERRERLIEFYKQKAGGDRHVAMQMAIEDRAKDGDKGR